MAVTQEEIVIEAARKLSNQGYKPTLAGIAKATGLGRKMVLHAVTRLRSEDRWPLELPAENKYMAALIVPDDVDADPRDQDAIDQANALLSIACKVDQLRREVSDHKYLHPCDSLLCEVLIRCLFAAGQAVPSSDLSRKDTDAHV